MDTEAFTKEVGTSLQHLHEFVGKVLTILVSVETEWDAEQEGTFSKESMFERDKTIFSGELMLSTIRQAMRDNSVGLGIQQSSKDLDSVNWAQNRLGDWMYTLHRIANVSRGTSDNRKLKILLASSGDPYVDNIRWLIDSHQMRRMVMLKAGSPLSLNINRGNPKY